MTSNEIVGAVLREVREDLGWTGEFVEVVTEGRIRRSTLGTWERGERALKLGTLCELADLYRVAPAHLLQVMERRARIGASA